MKRVLILGAGVAGLAAALRVLELRPDWEVGIIEKDDHAGGLASGWNIEDFSADLGPHRIYTELPEIERLLPELIGHEQLLTVQRQSELLLEGHYFQYPVKAGELLRVLGPVRMAKFAVSAAAAKLGGLIGGGRNFEEVMIHAFGAATYRLLVGPYARKVWKTEPLRLSAEVARVRVSAGNVNRIVSKILGRNEQKGRQTALKEFGYIRGGVKNLVENLRQKVEARGGTIALRADVRGFKAHGGELAGVRVTEVRRDDNGLALSDSHSDTSAVNLVEADYIISTIPLTELLDHLQLVTPDARANEAASEFTYLGLILVGLVIRKPQCTPNSWLYFPEEKYIFNRAYEPRNFDAGMAPGDRTLVVFEVTSRWDGLEWQQGDETIASRVREDAIKAGVVKPEEIESVHVRRVPFAYPLYTTEFRERLRTVTSYLRQFSNLVSTGRQGLFNHNNMDHSMLMGIRAAEFVAEEGEVAARWCDKLDQFSHFRIVD
ncbi:MAG: FAD-dependent oxidoreductase [Candidatus Sumerlaeaceae bacterium]|nr:FAD-dependent oxidoreductase [Candidatus Sumerlaeaceae bacterium]